MTSSNTKDKTIVIVDYGMGNVRSVQCALGRLSRQAIISNDPSIIEEADGLILPGVGAFGQAMQNLQERELVSVLNRVALKQGTPVLGICLGMQLFADQSDELGRYQGLAWIGGNVTKIQTEKLSLPHVGWNNVHRKSKQDVDLMFRGISETAHFYFDHSFHFQADASYVSGTTDYGNPLVAGVRKNSIWGVQFHPEKSHTPGLRLLRNFLTFVEGVPQC